MKNGITKLEYKFERMIIISRLTIVDPVGGNGDGQALANFQ